jgi:hypothetical protein
MAFSEMSAAHKNTVHPLLKSAQDMVRRYTRRAHHPHGLDIRRVLQTTDPSQVSSSVHSPCTNKTYDFRLKSTITHFLFPLPYIRYQRSDVRSRRSEDRCQRSDIGILSTVFHPLFSVFRVPSSVFRPLSSVLCLLSYAARIWDNSCCGLNPFSNALWEGQVAAHAPHPLQRILLTSQIFFSAE